MSEDISSNNKDDSNAAMHQELVSLKGSNTWKFVMLSENKKLIINRWTIRVKHKPDC